LRRKRHSGTGQALFASTRDAVVAAFAARFDRQAVERRVEEVTGDLPELREVLAG
jgi:hypothetical protein